MRAESSEESLGGLFSDTLKNVVLKIVASLNKGKKNK